MQRPKRREFLKAGLISTATAMLGRKDSTARRMLADDAAGEARTTLLDRRFLTFFSVVRVNQIEAARDKNLGANEAALHTPEAVQAFRDAFAEGWPGA
jgi:hypothetical protein